MELHGFCEVPGFRSLPLELLHFVQAIKYSLGQGEKSKRLSLLPSCSGAHLGCERCRVKSLLQRWFNYSYKVEQLQQEGCTCQQGLWPSLVLHKTSSLLTVGRLDVCFLLAKKMFPVRIVICEFIDPAPQSRAGLGSMAGFIVEALAEGGTAPRPPVIHLPSGSRISLLLCLTPWNLGYLPLLCREGKPSSCSGGRLPEGAGNTNFCRDFQGSQQLLWGGGSENKELPLQEGNLQNSLILFVSPEVSQCGYFALLGQFHHRYFFSQLTPLSKSH